MPTTNNLHVWLLVSWRLRNILFSSFIYIDDIAQQTDRIYIEVIDVLINSLDCSLPSPARLGDTRYIEQRRWSLKRSGNAECLRREGLGRTRFRIDLSEVKPFTGWRLLIWSYIVLWPLLLSWLSTISILGAASFCMLKDPMHMVVRCQFWGFVSKGLDGLASVEWSCTFWSSWSFPSTTHLFLALPIVPSYTV